MSFVSGLSMGGLFHGWGIPHAGVRADSVWESPIREKDAFVLSGVRACVRACVRVSVCVRACASPVQCVCFHPPPFTTRRHTRRTGSDAEEIFRPSAAHAANWPCARLIGTGTPCADNQSSRQNSKLTTFGDQHRNRCERLWIENDGRTDVSAIDCTLSGVAACCG